MNLTPAQLLALKNDVLADATLAQIARNADGFVAIAAAYNGNAAPDYWVWRTSVTELEYTRSAGVDTDGVTTTAFSWTVYISRSQGERDAWPRLFMGGATGCNPSLANVRQAFVDIFSGAGGANQRAHLSAISRRRASRGEKAFAVATVGGSGQRGLATNPDTMTAEGAITPQNVEAAFNG